MTTSINNGIHFVPENTIDPAAGLNIAINDIDAMLQCRVISIGDNTPPSEPEEGARYIVGAEPTGEWENQENKLARYLDSGWDFYDAKIVVNATDNSVYIFDGTRWVSSAILIYRDPSVLLIAPDFTGSSDGGFTLDTALDQIYTKCWLYFDENVLDSGNLAAFYPCVMTTDTDGTVYNHPYIPSAGSVAEWPETLIPFDDPIVGGAGVTGYTAAMIVTIPGGLVGDSGIINPCGFVQSNTNLSGFEVVLGDGMPGAILGDSSGGYALSSFPIFAQGQDRQMTFFTFGPVFSPGFSAIDMTVDQIYTIYLYTDASTDWARVMCTGLEIDNR